MEIAIAVVGTLAIITITAVADAIAHARHSEQRKIQRFRKDASRDLEQTSAEFRQQVKGVMRKHRK